MKDLEDLKRILGNEGLEITKAQTFNSYEQENLNFWTGKVISNSDSEKLGRVQIKVQGYYDNMPDKFLPWAVPDNSFVGFKKGSFVVPEVGTMLRGYFDKGDVQKPVYTALAFNEYNAQSDYSGRQSSLEYPNKMVLFETAKGDYLTMNRDTGVVIFSHRSGLIFKIDGDGNIDFENGNTSSSTSVSFNGDISVSCTGNASIEAMGSVDVKSTTGDITMGNNPNKLPLANLQNCYICGAPCSLGNIQVKA